MGNQEHEESVRLAPILGALPIDVKQTEPHASIRYLEFLKELCAEVPLDWLSEKDLTEDEQTKRKESLAGIVEWLQKCNKGSDEGTLMVYPYSNVVTHHMSNLKALMKTAYERKMEKARQVAEGKRRLAALEEINPPLDDANKFLDAPEYQQFVDSLNGAADAYLDGGRGCALSDWRLDQRAGRYIMWTGIIKERKGKAVRHQRAITEHDLFTKEIENAIAKLKKELTQEKRPKFVYPPNLANYEPHVWAELELPTEAQVRQWAEPYILKRVPQVLKPFTSWDLSWQVQTLPYAKYELVGVPCLTWCFRVLVLAEAHLRMVEKTFTKEFQGYEYKMMVKAEELGYSYLRPVQWEDQQEGFTTPLSLLSILATGELEDDGIEVMEQNGSKIEHCIRGYDDDCTEINEQFRQFIIDVAKDKPLAQGLLASGVIDEVTAKLIDGKSKVTSPPLVGVQTNAKKINDSEVVAALEAMGYKKAEIKVGMDATHLSLDMSLEEKVKAVLKNMGK